MFEVTFAGRVIHKFGRKQHKAGWLGVGGEAADAPVFVRTSDGAHDVVGLVEPYRPHCHLQGFQVKVNLKIIKIFIIYYLPNATDNCYFIFNLYIKPKSCLPHKWTIKCSCKKEHIY